MKRFLSLFLVTACVCASENDIVFKDVDGIALNLDIAVPSESGRFPLIVCIHGGGWRAGDKATWNEDRLEAQINIHEFAKRGIVAATINYRLAPTYKLDAMLADIESAVAFLHTNAERYKIDPTRIAFAGDSAGGHLALMSGILLKRKGFGVRGVVNMFGLTDLHDASARVDNGNLSFVVADFVGTNDPDSEAARLASPARILDGSAPPVLTLHGTDDPIIGFAQAVVLHRALRVARVKGCELVSMRGQGHGWGTEKTVAASNRRVFSFLKKVFK